MEPRYRPAVAGIFQRADGRILICERCDKAGAWQFAQGGVDDGESAEQAFRREMEEELSVRPEDYRIIDCKSSYRYLFPNGVKKRGWDGQEQTYFLARLTGAETCVNVATAHPEFRAVRWILPEEFDLAWLPEFKREVYRAVLADFFGVSL